MVAVIRRPRSDAYYDAMARRSVNKRTAIHYVYALIDPRDDRVRYIGCSMNPWHRRRIHMSCCDLHDVRSWTRELRSLKLITTLVILDQGIGFLPTKRIEDRYIDEYDQFHGGLLNRHCPLVWKRKKAESLPALLSPAEAMG